jgi:predicted nuclease of predicted toxin-antitoxin system
MDGIALLSGRFLIDECLSASLVAVAKERGLQADYVTYIGKSGWSDWNLASYALENDYVFVTNNRRDFLKEYAKLDLHNGLIIIVPDTKRADQQRLFAKVLKVVCERNDGLVNKLIEVLLDGSVHIKDWTSRDHHIGHISSPEWKGE